MSGTRREPAVEEEYALDARSARRWTAAQTLTVAAAVAVAGTLFVGFPAYGLTDTTSFGSVVRAWGRPWCVVTGGAAIVLAAAAVVARSATRAAVSGLLERRSGEPGAGRRVPVAAQRALLTADPWNSTRLVGSVAATVGTLFALLFGAVAAARAADGGATGPLVAAGVLAGVAAVGFVGSRLARRVGRRPLSSASLVWPLYRLHQVEQARTRSAATSPRTVSRPGGGDRLPIVSFTVGAVLLLTAVGLCIARRPYRRRPRLTYGPGTEAALDVVWAGLLGAALLLAVAGLVSWSRRVRARAGASAQLEQRVRTGATGERPSAARLAQATGVPGAAALAGRGAVGTGTLVGCGGVTTLLLDATAGDTAVGEVLVLGVVLVLTGVAAVALGVRSIAADPVSGRVRREAVRTAWPVDPLVGLPDGEAPVGRTRRRRPRDRSTTGDGS